MNLPDFLVDCTHKGLVRIQIAGTCVDLYDVIDKHQKGMAPKQISEERPSLSLEKVNDVLAFYRDNRAEVDAYVDAVRADLKRWYGNAPPPHVSAEALRRQYKLDEAIPIRKINAKLPEFLVEWPYGEIMLAGHRISLFHVIDKYKEGWIAEQILEQLPSLSLEKINNVIGFYHANRDEVDSYVTDYRAELDRLEACAPPPKVSLEEMRRRLEAKKRQMGL